VKAIVANWEATNQQHSIQWLAEHPLDATQFGLSEAEVSPCGVRKFSPAASQSG
jgi:hypothetical protein